MRHLDSLSYGMLIALVAVLSWKVSGLGNANAALRLQLAAATSASSSSALRLSAGTPTSYARLPPFSLPYLPIAADAPVETLRFSDASLGTLFLFVFFTDGDCYAGLVDAPFWSELRQEFGTSLQVTGITTGDRVRKVRHFLKRQNIEIPVLYDQGRELFKMLEDMGHALTPVMLLTTSDGFILHIRGSYYGNRDAQMEYKRLLRQLLSM